jgi:DNA polymerase-4
VGRIWGIGRVTGETFSRLGVQTIADLRQLPIETLRQHFGSSGEHFWKLAHGVDDRPVVPDREAKSISHETTFAQDIGDHEVLRSWLLELTEQVAYRLRRHGLRSKVVQIKVRFSDFQTITRSKTLAEATDSTQVLWETSAELLSARLSERHLPVRLLGMGVSGIDHSQITQRSLFSDGQQDTQLDAVGDGIRDRFGTGALRRGSNLRHGAGHHPTEKPDLNSGRVG